MKKNLLTLSAVIALLLVTSCNQGYDEILSSDDYVKALTRVETNLLDVDPSELDTTYFVAGKDVEAYIHHKKMIAESTKQDFSVIEVKPLSLENECTLGYLLNYNEGWEIISADKRCPLVLASNDIGSLDLCELPANVLTWIRSLEFDVLYMRAIHGIPNDINEEQKASIQASLDFWGSILGTQDFIEEYSGQIIESLPLDGYWELVSSEVIDTETLYATHLINIPYSNFHQNPPYNYYCPLVNNYSTEHVPAGCVAVAGSMMLGYLNQKLGVPTMGLEIAYNSGSVSYPGPFVSYVVDDDHANIWTHLGYPTYAAALIAYVGYLVNMDYDPSGSSANTADLVDEVFDYFGISCVHRSLSTSLVNNSLQNEMPVIVSAYSAGTYQNGHAFIIDSYGKIAKTYRNTYVWHYTGSSSLPRPDIDPEVRIEYGLPEFALYRMRWGWENSDYDWTWFAISGNWEITNSIGTFNYIYQRNMIYNFAAD